MRLAMMILILVFNNGYAQQSGEVNYPSLGITFTIPVGWVGQEVEDLFVMGSTTEPGRIIMSQQAISGKNALEQLLINGLHVDAGTQLNADSSVSTAKNDGLSVMLKGMMEYVAVKGYIVGRMQNDQQVILIMAVSSPENFNQTHVALVNKISDSLRFSQPQQSAQAVYFNQQLRNVRLSYLDSYSSMDYSDSGISGGYEMRKNLDLCAEGHFYYSGYSNMNAGGDNASAYGNYSSAGHGSWKVTGVGDEVYLQLSFNDGDVVEKALTEKDGGLYLDGGRYYRQDSQCQ
ncbi:hypothetical protein [Marinicella sp. W31]|uniref:hypothetical protein n=1 Tax=Marinicella sp. W31 TaxID=3023713 RepID=UPI003756C899